MLPTVAAPVRIPLINGGFVVVDNDDLDAVSEFEWKQARIGAHAYARTDIGTTTVLMHRFLFGLARGDRRVVDHIDGDGLNNSRSNLRICTAADNARNRRRSSNSTGYKGVYPRGYSFVAQIGDEKKYLGAFRSSHEAALAYNEAARARFGEFAALNRIDIEAYRAELLKFLAQAREEVCLIEQKLAGLG